MTAFTQPCREWQQIREDLWFFGVKVRGIVRKCDAYVKLCSWGDNRNTWVWHRKQEGGVSNYSLVEAIEMAERSVGLAEWEQ